MFCANFDAARVTFDVRGGGGGARAAWSARRPVLARRRRCYEPALEYLLNAPHLPLLLASLADVT